MKQSECLGVNQQGHLTIGGCDTVLLAEQYGTPLYVMDEEGIRAACRSYRSSIDRFYGGRGMVCYASKAFCCKEICRIMDAEQMGLDVVSEGELYTALAAGFPAERICFHGNNKTDHELKYALQSGIGLFIVDNRYELERLNRFAGELGVKAQIAFRIKPGVDAHTHDFVRTGQIDSKFGVALETGEAMEIVLEALQMENLCLKGVHCHIGSQIFELEPFELAAQRMVEFMVQVRDRTGYVIEQLDLGGGFGICYTQQDAALRYDSYMEKVSVVVKSCCERLNFPQPFMMLEPGRSIVGPSRHYPVHSRSHQGNPQCAHLCGSGRRNDRQPALCALPIDIRSSSSQPHGPAKDGNGHAGGKMLRKRRPAWRAYAHPAGAKR